MIVFAKIKEFLCKLSNSGKTDYKCLIVTVLAKTGLVRTKTEFNFIASVYRHTQYLSIPSVSSVKCYILPTLQSHSWNNGTHGGRQLAVGIWIYFHWLCGPLVCHWPLCGHHGCSWSVPRGGFCHFSPHPTPPHPSPSHPTTHSTHPFYYQY